MSSKTRDSYGFIAKPEQEAIKQFARLTKNEIAQQEPGVNLPNQVVSTLYKVPDTLNALINVLSLGNPTAARGIQTITGLPGELLQKIIPQGGGYLKQAIPGLFQLGGQLSNQTQ